MSIPPPVTDMPKKGLSPEEEKEILKAISDFKKWLIEKKVVKKLPDINLGEIPFANEDWTMQYDAKSNTVSFNSFSRSRGSFDYFTSIVLHEYFHLVIQRVPNKDNATKIKDDFGGELMKLIDIEADFYTALFFKERYNYGLVQYLKLYYEGTAVFRDKWIRVTKLERFIGTLLSISKMFISHHKITKKVQCYDLYLVSISPFFTEDSLHVLVVRKEHIYFDLIHAEMQDFNKIKDCYTNEDSISLKAYVSKIVTFVTKALRITLPSEIQDEINKL